MTIFLSDKYKGKVVWITGASSGVGEGLAYVLASTGAKLVLSGTNKERLEKVKQQCLRKFFILFSHDPDKLILFCNM